MPGYIEKVLLNNVNLENNNEITNKTSINDIIELISKTMIKKYSNKSMIDEFIDEYLKIDSTISFSYDIFTDLIENNIIDLEMIKRFLEKKPTKEEIFDIKMKNILIKIEKIPILNRGFTKYSDETIANFIKYFILNCNLIQDFNQDETPLDYLKRIYNIYFPSSQEFPIKSLKNKFSSRFYGDLLKFHSLILSKSIETNGEIIKMFTDFLEKLYFDRDDGYKVKSFDFTKPFETINLDINTLFQNTPFQVNLFCFIEEQREPDYKIRTDLILIKKLLDIAKIFNLIGHDIIIISSQFKTNDNNQGMWLNIPYKFNDIYEELIKKYPKLPFNTINIYIQVDFDCL
jgi:hypothetical protein